MQRFVIGTNEAGRRLDQYLNRILPEAGTSFIFKMVRKKNITVNRKKVEPNIHLCAGDSVEMFFSDDTFVKMSGGKIPLSACSIDKKNLDKPLNKDLLPEYVNSLNISEYQKAYSNITDIHIVYEDDDFIFIDKPVNVLSQKANASDVSVNEWLIGYLLETNKISPNELVTFKPAFCNRLDRNTTGLMLGGKNLGALQTLSELLRSRDLEKYYYSKVYGVPDDKFPIREDRFEHFYGFLVKNNKKNQVKIYDNETDALEYASEINSQVSEIHTSVRLVSSTSTDTENFMNIEIDLHTGKAHQIRAHLAHLGHPIVGDPKYGRKDVSTNDSFQILRAYRVVFPSVDKYPAISNREFRIGEQIC